MLAPSLRPFFCRLASSGPVVSIFRTPGFRFMSTTDHTVTLGQGQPIGYVETGSGDRTVLLLPGALGTARSDFSQQLDHFAGHPRLKVIAWDPPGYGRSRPPARTWPKVPNFYHRDAEVAAELMEQLGHRTYSLVGWSDGAITSLIMAAKFPDRIDRSVVYAGQAYYTPEDMKMLGKVADLSGWSERMRKPMEDLYGKVGRLIWI